MEDKVTRFPLDWPVTVKRLESWKRGAAKFKRGGAPIGYTDGIRRVKEELRRFNAKEVVISIDIDMRTDSAPYSGGVKANHDVGAVVYFKLDGKAYCLPCDRWNRLGDNLAAIAAHLEAMRGMLRWGVGSIEQAFAGYKALPAPGQTSGESWWTVLGVQHTATAAEIKSAYREMAHRHHPDKGGSPEFWHRIVNAYDQAQQKGLVT